MCALPSERLDNVDNILTVLLFPAPFGPRRPNISPKFTEKETPEIAFTPFLYILERFSTFIAIIIKNQLLV